MQFLPGWTTTRFRWLKYTVKRPSSRPYFTSGFTHEKWKLHPDHSAVRVWSARMYRVRIMSFDILSALYKNLTGTFNDQEHVRSGHGCGMIWGQRFDRNPCATLHCCTIHVTATVSKNKENGSGWRCPDNVAPLHITCCTSICKRP